MPTTLYIKVPPTSLCERSEIKSKLESTNEADKYMAMKTLVVLMSQGNDLSDHINYAIKGIIPYEKNKALKKLFYQFLELIPKTDRNGKLLGEMLLICNQIRKDIMSPNEYMRGLAMRFVSTLKNSEILEVLYKPVKDNLLHPHSYVRRHACHCLAQIYKTFPEAYPEIPQLLVNCLQTETDPLVLRQAYALHTPKRDMYKPDLSSIPFELFELMSKNGDEDFFMRCIEIQDERINFLACINLLRITNKENIFKMATERILEIIKGNPLLRDVAITEFRAVKANMKFEFNGYAMDIMELLETYDYEFNEKCVSFAFEILDSREYLEMCGVFARLFKENNHNSEFKIFLYQKMAVFTATYGLVIEKMIEPALGAVTNTNPELAYASLKFLSASLNNKVIPDVNEILVESISEIKFGKIFRCVLNVITIHGTKRDLIKLIEIFEEALNSKMINNKANQRMPILSNLFEPSLPFSGGFIAISLATLYGKLKEGSNNIGDDDISMKEISFKIIALLLKIVHKGESVMDLTSRSTIITAIRYLTNPQLSLYPVNYYSLNYIQSVNFDDPICFSIAPPSSKKISTEIFDTPTAHLENVHQLTGMGDPVYCEACVKYSKLSITLDLLLINQTNSFLQNVILDFTTSSNISQETVPSSFSMTPRSITNLYFTFRVSEVANGFISGSVSFRYPGEEGEYANTGYTVFMDDIRLEVTDFLQPVFITDEQFRDTWRILEWENSYSIKLNSEVSFRDVLGMLCDKLRGKIVSMEDGESYLVCNMICSTYQGDLVFLNIAMQAGELTGIYEFRIRCGKENLVKSFSLVVGEMMKRINVK